MRQPNLTQELRNPAQDYILGNGAQEQNRLKLQAGILEKWTEGFFRAAGIGPRMKVLDLGCGMGDVSLLAAKLVGPSGSVIGRHPCRDAATALILSPLRISVMGSHRQKQPINATTVARVPTRPQRGHITLGASLYSLRPPHACHARANGSPSFRDRFRPVEPASLASPNFGVKFRQ
jgi:hypothetical protein